MRVTTRRKNGHGTSPCGCRTEHCRRGAHHRAPEDDGRERCGDEQQHHRRQHRDRRHEHRGAALRRGLADLFPSRVAEVFAQCSQPAGEVDAAFGARREQLVGASRRGLGRERRRRRRNDAGSAAPRRTAVRTARARRQPRLRRDRRLAGRPGSGRHRCARAWRAAGSPCTARGASARRGRGSRDRADHERASRRYTAPTIVSPSSEDRRTHDGDAEHATHAAEHHDLADDARPWSVAETRRRTPPGEARGPALASVRRSTRAPRRVPTATTGGANSRWRVPPADSAGGAVTAAMSASPRSRARATTVYGRTRGASRPVGRTTIGREAGGCQRRAQGTEQERGIGHEPTGTFDDRPPARAAPNTRRSSSGRERRLIQR